MPTTSQLFPTSTKRKNILDAARRAVAKDRPTVTPGFEAHHVGEKFANIWDKFAAQNPQLVGPDLAVKVNAMGKYPKFIDTTINKEFRAFHKEHVEWKVLSHEEHLAIHQAEDAAQLAANEAKTKVHFIEWADSQDSKNFTPFNPTEDIARAFETASMSHIDYMSEITDKLISYNIVNKEAVAWVEQHGADAMKTINNTTKDAIRLISQRGLQEGLTVKEQAKLIKEQIGLLPNSVTAVANYKKQLEDMGIADSAIERKVAKYTQQLLNYRAETIAITENQNASTMSHAIVNEGLINDGIIQVGEYVQKWVTAEDERLCPLCKSLDNKVAPIGSWFPGIPYGEKAHPRCRCTVVLVDSKTALVTQPEYSIPTTEDVSNYIGSPPGFENDPLKSRWQAKQDLQTAMRPESLKINDLSREDKTTLLQYTSHTNQPINKYLNGGMENLDLKDAMLVKTKQDVADMDRILSNLKLDSNIKAFRGLSPSMGTYNDALTSALESPGSIIQMNGFTSTSISPDQAMKFASKSEGRLLELLLPKGTPAAYLRSVSASASEEELLLSRGLTYIVGGTRDVSFLSPLDGSTYQMTVTTLKAVLPDYVATGPMAQFAENQLFKESLTNAAAAEWRTIFKAKYPDLQVYLNGMNEDLQLRTYLSLNKVLKDIPDPRDVLSKVWTQEFGKGFFTGAPNAYAAAAEKEIQLNLGYFANKDTLMSYIKNDIASGFHPEGFSPEWIINHEIGHTVFNGLKLYNPEVGKEILGIINKARQSGDLAAWGKYAASSPDEAFAEIYAGIYSDAFKSMPSFVAEVKKVISYSDIPGDTAHTVNGIIQAFPKGSTVTGTISDKERADFVAKFTKTFPDVSLQLDPMDNALAVETLQTVASILLRSKYITTTDDLVGALKIADTQTIYDEIHPNAINAYATTTRQETWGVITFNPKYYAIPKATIDYIVAKDVESGFHYKGMTSQGIVVHEIGHNAADYLQKNYMPDYLKIQDIIKTALNDGSLKQFSQYAATNYAEAFAEVYSAIYTVPSSELPPFVNKINAILAGEKT